MKYQYTFIFLFTPTLLLLAWMNGFMGNIRTLEQDVDLSQGFIMDEMLQIGILTDNENQELREENRPNKIRLLATILARKNKGKFQEFFLVWLPKKSFTLTLEKTLNVAYEAKKKEKENQFKCIRCFIIEKVDIQQIQDHFCETHVIGLQEISSLIK